MAASPSDVVPGLNRFHLTSTEIESIQNDETTHYTHYTRYTHYTSLYSLLQSRLVFQLSPFSHHFLVPDLATKKLLKDQDFVATLRERS